MSLNKSTAFLLKSSSLKKKPNLCEGFLQKIQKVAGVRSYLQARLLRACWDWRRVITSGYSVANASMNIKNEQKCTQKNPRRPIYLRSPGQKPISVKSLTSVSKSIIKPAEQTPNATTFSHGMEKYSTRLPVRPFLLTNKKLAFIRPSTQIRKHYHKQEQIEFPHCRLTQW